KPGRRWPRHHPRRVRHRQPGPRDRRRPADRRSVQMAGRTAAVRCFTLYRSKTGFRGLTCDSVRCRSLPRRQAVRHGRVVRIFGPASGAAVDRVGPAGRWGEGGRCHGAAPPGRGAAPSGQTSGSGTIRSGGALDVFAAAAPTAVGNVHGHPGHVAALAPHPDRREMDLSPAPAGPPAGSSGNPGPWCCAWRRRTRAGVIAGSRVNWSAWAYRVAASTVWCILTKAGVDPAPRRTGPTWTQFLGAPAKGDPGLRFSCTSTRSG
ncbi:MAG: putative transposase, partial [Actinoplanes sp.]|nr:putative transposase [Actinoplanes sp.]